VPKKEIDIREWTLDQWKRSIVWAIKRAVGGRHGGAAGKEM
jgi:hypothetical protein